MKRAIITGAGGQDGSYLTEFLLGKGYEVLAIIHAYTPCDSLDHLLTLVSHEKSLATKWGSINDEDFIRSTIQQFAPDEFYNLASHSHVGRSFDDPVLTTETTAMATLKILECLRRHRPNIRFFQAGSSEMFGRVAVTPQNETTAFEPRSPYGCAKAFSHMCVKQYRTTWGLYACNGIMYNHESERRSDMFVTRKVTKAAARIKLGKQDRLVLGPLDVKRDWGYAPDYVEAMWMTLQADHPDDYVIGTGKLHTLEELVHHAFYCVGLDSQHYVTVDQSFARPAEVHTLCADSSKIKTTLGWQPKTKFGDMIEKMVAHDLKVESSEGEYMR